MPAQNEQHTIHICHDCKEEFDHNSLLKHLNEFPEGACTKQTFICECGKFFVYKASLRKHQILHANSRAEEELQQEQQQE